MDIIIFVMISAFLNIGRVMFPAPCGFVESHIKYSLFKLNSRNIIT